MRCEFPAGIEFANGDAPSVRLIPTHRSSDFKGGQAATYASDHEDAAMDQNFRGSVLRSKETLSSFIKGITRNAALWRR